MDADQRIINWALGSASELQLRVKSYQWPGNPIPGLYDVSCTITVSQITSVGRGSGFSQEEAFLKALSEAIERWVFETADAWTTNGFACHSSLQAAQEAAANEIVERDAFLSHYLTGTGFQAHRLSFSHFDKLDSYIRKLRSRGIELFLGEATGVNGSLVSVCSAFGLAFLEAPFGMCLGLGCSIDPLQSAQSALMECLRHLVAIISSPRAKPLSAHEFSMLPKHRVEDHIALALDHRYANEALPYFSKLEKSRSGKKQIEDFAGFEFIERFPQDSIFLGAPIKVVQAVPKNPDSIQNLFFGPIRPDQVNLKRLTNLNGIPVTWNDLIKIPHPLG